MQENKLNIKGKKQLNCIYIGSYLNSSTHEGLVKIGETKISKDIDEIKKAACMHRLKEGTGQTGLDAELNYYTLAEKNVNDKGGFPTKQQFTDKKFHKWLKEKYNISHVTNLAHAKEWFRLTPERANEYLQNYINDINALVQFTFRPNQEEAAKKIQDNYITASDSGKNNFLLNAVMRFGKCATIYKAIKDTNKIANSEKEIKNILILTHRPSVLDSWKNDFINVLGDDNEYKFFSPNQKEYFINDKTKHKILFSSLQDLRGKKSDEATEEYDIDGDVKGDAINTSKWKESNKELIQIQWDVIILDEAHEGQLSLLANDLHNDLKRKYTIYLSGTPYKLLKQDTQALFDDDSHYDWDYVKEQEAKEKFEEEYPDDLNPYFDLPKITLLGIDICKETYASEYGDDENGFEFSELFSANKNEFDHKNDVKKFLDAICDEKRECMPFNKENKDNTIHSMWLLPSVDSCKCIKKILNEHPFFKNYKVFNAAGNDFDRDILMKMNETINQIDKERKSYDSEQKRDVYGTITLTYNRLTVGTTIDGLTSVMVLNDTKSVQFYMQAIFRAKSPNKYGNDEIKVNSLVFDFAPNRMLEIYEDWSGISENRSNEGENSERENLKKLLKYANVLVLEDNKFKDLKFDEIITRVTKAAANHIFEKRGESDKIFNKHELQKLASNSIELERINGVFGPVYKKETEQNTNKIVINQHEFIPSLLSEDVPVELAKKIQETLKDNPKALKAFDKTTSHNEIDIQNFHDSCKKEELDAINDLWHEHKEQKKTNPNAKFSPKYSPEERKIISYISNFAHREELKEILSKREFDEYEEIFNAKTKDMAEFGKNLNETEKQKILDKIKKDQDIKDKIKTVKTAMKTYAKKVFQLCIGIGDKFINNEVGFDFDKFNSLIKDEFSFYFEDEAIRNEMLKNIHLLDKDVILAVVKKNNDLIEEANKYIDTNPSERTKQICYVLDHFPEDSKEVVFTPAEVARKVIEKANISVDEMNKKDFHYLDINAKSGIFPLLVATKIYENDHRLKWKQILRNNIYAITNSKIALEIILRILGINKEEYAEWAKINIQHFSIDKLCGNDNILEDSEETEEED